MTLRGTVHDGVIRIEGNPQLPEGATVEVIVRDPIPQSLTQRMKHLVGTAKGLPADMAQNHDHYIHGAPRRDQD